MTADRITALEDITDPAFIWGAMDNVHDAETTLADYADAVSRAQRAALAASRAAPDCHQPDLVTADKVRIKPLVWDGFVAGSYHIEIEDGGIANLWRYSAEMVENKEPEYIRGGYLTIVSLDDLKAAAQADYEARILAALDLTPAPAVEPVAMTAQDAARVLRSWWNNSYCVSDARIIVSVCETLRNHTEDQWQQFDAALRAIGGDA